MRSPVSEGKKLSVETVGLGQLSQSKCRKGQVLSFFSSLMHFVTRKLFSEKLNIYEKQRNHPQVQQTPIFSRACQEKGNQSSLTSLIYKAVGISISVFFLCLYSSNASAASNVTPNPGYVGDSFTYTVTLSGNLPTGYVLKIELGNGGGGYLTAQKMTGSGTIFSYARVINKAGSSRTYRYAIFQGTAIKTAWFSGTYVVKKKPIITIPSVPTPQSPTNNATLTGTAQTMTWSAPTGATSYELALRDATNNRWIFGGSKAVKITTTSSFRYTAFTTGLKYVWTVQARNWLQ